MFTDNLGDSPDYEDIFPDETVRRLKILLKKVNKCQPLVNAGGLYPAPEFRHLDNYESPPPKDQHQQSSRVSSHGVPTEFLNEFQPQLFRQYGTYPTWLIVKNVAPVFTSSGRLYEPPSQIRHRREQMAYRFN
uniref:Uncharacterized protein n=1 Tax=Photinus pyralis TaxID=7054 RepID=A0A1Y1LZH9_PHOPY